MKLLNHSNSIHKVKKRKKLNPKIIAKFLALLIIVGLLGGFIYEKLSFANDLAALKTKSKYSTINGKEIHFKYSSGGEYTLIFESDIGYTYYEWDKVIELMPDNIEVNTFMYDRSGYGDSEKLDYENPEAQAKKLHLLFRKIGLEAPYILVGDGYGSLVMTNFAKLYKDEIAGMVLINPINEEYMKTSEFIKEKEKGAFRRKVEQLGSYVGFTRTLERVGLVNYPAGLLENVSDVHGEDIRVHRVSDDFATAVINETQVLLSGDSTSQSPGMIGDNPLAIVVNEKNNIESQRALTSLTGGSSQFIQSVNPEGEVIPLENYKAVQEAIKFVVRENEKKTQ